MATPQVFIDGQQGSTGLRIQSLLAERNDIDLLTIEESRRKDRAARQECLQAADFAVLCLPDAASAEAVELVNTSNTRLIDTSSARRLEPGWVYGLPEMAATQRQLISESHRVANPGCYPQSLILTARPLIESGILSPDMPLTVNAVSGYSGGGRQMVDSYRSLPVGPDGDSRVPFCLYGLEGEHKHLPEMREFSLLTNPPLFVPSVDNSFCGMLVSIPIPARALGQGGAAEVYEVLQRRYANEPLLNVYGPDENSAVLRDGKFLDLVGQAGNNSLDLMVFDRKDTGVLVVGRLDNLGKGAAGNAVQCLNIMMGIDERTGLVHSELTRLAS